MIKTITANGKYRFSRTDEGFRSIVVDWNSTSITPAGTLSFNVNGEVGEVAGVMYLSTGARTLGINMPLPFVDCTVTGLPTNAVITVYLQ